jgi:hypothetical protein
MNKQEFLMRGALRRANVETDAGVAVVRELTVAERALYVELAKASPHRLVPWLVAACLVDPELAEDEAAGLSPALLEVLARAALQVSGLVDAGND